MKNRFLKTLILLFLALSFFNFAGCAGKKHESPKNIQINASNAEADKYFKEQNWDKAIELLKKRIESNPNDIQARLLLGQSYIQVRKPDEAFAEFQKCAKLDPKRSLIYDGIGWAYLLKSGGGKDKESLEKAKVNFKTALGIKTDDSMAYNGLGWYNLYDKNLEPSKENFNRALKIDPANYSAYTGLGYVNIHQKDYSAALENFKKAKKTNAKDIAVFNGMGLTYVKMGKYPEAEKEFRAALLLDKNDITARVQLAAALMLEGEYAKGLEEFQAANQISPQDELKELITAMRSYMSKDYDNAIAGLRKMIPSYPREAAEFYWLIGKCYENQKNPGRAKIEYQNSLRTFPGFIPAERSLKEL